LPLLALVEFDLRFWLDDRIVVWIVTVSTVAVHGITHPLDQNPDSADIQ